MLNIKKVKPMGNYIVVTKDEYTDNDCVKSGVITKVSGAIKEYQKVIAVGPYVKNIKEGDLVSINPKRYALYKHEKGSLKDGVITDNPVVGYNFPLIELNHVPHLLLTDLDIEFVIEDSEEEPDNIIPSPKVIVPKKKIRV